jgi:hypothetical protein
MTVTAISVTATGVAGGIAYSGTYQPAGLSPAPLIFIDAPLRAHLHIAPVACSSSS